MKDIAAVEKVKECFLSYATVSILSNGLLNWNNNTDGIELTNLGETQ